MAAFTGALQTLLGNGKPGPTYRFSHTDAAGAFTLWVDTPGSPAALTIPASGLRLADVSVSTVGGTVVALQLVKGTERKGVILPMGPLLNTLAGMDGKSRLGSFWGAPLEPGAQYSFIGL